MTYLQAIGSHFSTLQVYGVAVICFMLIPAMLAGGAAFFMWNRRNAP